MIFNLNKENKSLVQKQEMKEPPHYAFTPDYSAEDYFKDLDKYNEQKAKCKTYDISGIVPESWETGRDIIEDVDFLKVNVCEDGQRCECNNSDAEKCLYSKFIAVPIVQPIQEVEVNNEDELWDEIIGICFKAQVYKNLNRIQDFRNEMDKLKSFTIQRK